jgi:glutamyl-tRNA reductase
MQTDPEPIHSTHSKTMPIITVGLSHRTAPVELRESVSIGETDLSAVLCRIHACDAIEEVAILSTCNRLEIYAVTPKIEEGWQAIESVLQGRAGDRAIDLTPHLYYYAERSSAYHLMEVACGLDSLILGEPQILGQVSYTLIAAQQAGTVGAVLHRLFTGAIHAGKRARAETAISRYTTSTSHAAVLLAQSQVEDLRKVRVLVVGAGEMAHLAIKALRNHNVEQIGCINRTYCRAASMVKLFNGQTFNWFNLHRALLWADVVITATGAPHTVIHREEVAEIHTQRQGRPLIFVDIALPRDVEENVEDLPGVHRFDIDDLRATLDANLAQRQAARPHVEEIIDQEIAEFVAWHNSRQAIPTLVEMRRKVQEIAQSELAEALSQLSELTDREEEVVRRMVHRLVNKVLHEPTVQLKTAAAESPEVGQGYAEAVRMLFDLEPTPAEAATPVATNAESTRPLRLHRPAQSPYPRGQKSAECIVESAINCASQPWTWNGA